MKMKSPICTVLTVAFVACFAISGNAQEEYELSFEGRWFDNVERPGNAHFTTVIGSTHNAAGSLFAVGEQASAGVENVAELGSINALVGEINTNIAAGTAGSLVQGTDSFISPEELNVFNFTATDAHSQLSILTMLAPSPDWFVGVNSLDLKDGDGNWIDSIVLDLNSYDAGTEEGTGLSLSNPATNPQEDIALLDDAEPLGALSGAGSLARLRLTRVNAVPEPGTATLLGATFIGFAGFRRRRQ